MRTKLTLLLPGILAALLMTVAFSAEPGAQSSKAGGVTVAVTAQNLAASAKSWDFKVVLDTHSSDLSDDLLKTATLIDDKGSRHAPVKWEGAGPGGHHREGILKFNPVSPMPGAIELRITRAEEPQPRSFHWRLK